MYSDAFDAYRRVLALLEIDSRRTGEQLSSLVGLSPAACLRCGQRLRKIGAIEREIAMVSPEYKSDKGTKIIVLLTIDGQNPRIMNQYCDRLRQQDEVESLDWVTGDEDIVFYVDCPVMAHCTKFGARHLSEPPVVGYKTLASLKQYDTTGQN